MPPKWVQQLRQMQPKAARDWLTFALGGTGLILQTLAGGVEKPTLIIAFVGMMGLPLFMRKDEADAKMVPVPIPPPLIPMPLPPVAPVVAPAAGAASTPTA